MDKIEELKKELDKVEDKLDSLPFDTTRITLVVQQTPEGLGVGHELDTEEGTLSDQRMEHYGTDDE